MHEASPANDFPHLVAAMPSTIPAIPPYTVKTPHLHGASPLNDSPFRRYAPVVPNMADMLGYVTWTLVFR